MLAFVLGIVLGIVILFVLLRQRNQGPAPASKPTALGWWTLGLGLAGAIAFSVAMFSGRSGNSATNLFPISVVLSFAAAAVGISALVRRERAWQVWLGFAAGLLVALFWVAFAFGSLFAG